MAIAKRAARDGAKIVIAAKTTEENIKLPGTIYTAAKEIESLGVILFLNLELIFFYFI